MNPPDLAGRLRLTLGDRGDTAIRENDFFEATMHVLGVASGYRPRVFIPGWQINRRTGRSTLRDKVLRTVGINPDDPDTFPMNQKGRKYTLNDGRAALYDVLDWGPSYAQGFPWKSQKFGGLGLVVKGRVENGNPVEIGQGRTGSWALTEAGVALAAKVHSHYMLPAGAAKNKVNTDRNLTCCWLNAQIAEHGLYDRLFDTLSQLQQIRKETEAGQIKDHINHWFSLAIRRDGLRSRLETYDPPTFRQIRDWCLNALWTTLRGRAQDADDRMTYGALTERERATGATATAAVTASPFMRIIQKSEDSDEVAEDLVDRDAYARDQRALDFALGMEHVERAFQIMRPGNASRLAKVFKTMAQGTSVLDMAGDENVSRNRMASILGAVRGALRDARQMSGDIQTVLEFVQENPWSTRDDLIDVFVEKQAAPMPDVDALLVALVETGRLSPQKFKAGVGFITTDAADAFLNSRDAADPVGSILL